MIDRLKASTAPRYAHLYGCELWLPSVLTTPFHGLRLSGDATRIGSSLHLLDELRQLNGRTFKGSPEELDGWGREVPDGSDERFEPRAKAGLSIMLRLTALAVEHRLPMLLDY